MRAKEPEASQPCRRFAQMLPRFWGSPTAHQACGRAECRCLTRFAPSEQPARRNLARNTPLAGIQASGRWQANPHFAAVPRQNPASLRGAEVRRPNALPPSREGHRKFLGRRTRMVLAETHRRRARVQNTSSFTAWDGPSGNPPDQGFPADPQPDASRTERSQTLRTPVRRASILPNQVRSRPHGCRVHAWCGQ